MNRYYAALVHRVGIRASLDQTRDDLGLGARIPRAKRRPSVGGVVQRFGTPTVSRANVCPAVDQRLSHRAMVRGCGNVQRGIPFINVVLDVFEVVSEG
jgi:hypothetical protein